MFIDLVRDKDHTVSSKFIDYTQTWDKIVARIERIENHTYVRSYEELVQSLSMPTRQIHYMNVISDLERQNTVPVFRMQLLREEATL
jgi:hypothetical protein